MKPLRPHPPLPKSAFSLRTNNDGDSKVKVVVVGDGNVGKTCLLFSFTKGEFPMDYIPTVFDGYAARLTFQGRKIYFQPWDTAGQDEFDAIRPYVYPSTDVFLVCCSVSDKNSLLHVGTKWVPEIKKHSCNTPIILVGTKSDLRAYRGRSDSYYSSGEGRAAAQKYRMEEYIECSAKTHQNVRLVFGGAIYHALKKNVIHSNCIVL